MTTDIVKNGNMTAIPYFWSNQTLVQIKDSKKSQVPFGAV